MGGIVGAGSVLVGLVDGDELGNGVAGIGVLVGRNTGDGRVSLQAANPIARPISIRRIGFARMLCSCGCLRREIGHPTSGLRAERLTLTHSIVLGPNQGRKQNHG